MSEATIDENEIDGTFEEETVSEYTSETPTRPVVTREIVGSDSITPEEMLLAVPARIVSTIGVPPTTSTVSEIVPSASLKSTV